MTSVNAVTKQSGFPIFLDYFGYFGMHVACLGVFWTGVRWSDIALCFSLYLVRMFGLMAGYHRYFSHRSFKTSRIFQFLLGLLGALGYQKGPLWWASHHRYHHRYSDTYLDYHSPIHRSFLYSHSGWFLDRDNRQTKIDRVADLARYPELVWLDNWNLIPVFSLALMLLLLLGWGGFIWGFCINTILIWHAIHAIGSFGHSFGGYRRFATTDNSRNKWFIALLLLGEGWHNNHHFYPSSARHGFVWWEIDTVYYILRVMSWLGLIWDLRLPPAHLYHGKGPLIQSNLRKFELWLVNLRLQIARQVESVAQHDDDWKPEEEASLQLFKQSIEIRLDDFAADVIQYLHRNPERLKDAVSVLRLELDKEVDSFSERVRKEPILAALPTIKYELLRHLLNCPFSHLFLEQEESKKFILEPSF